MPAILPVKSHGEIQTVAQLARKIWTHHFVPIVGQAQVDYMLGSIQSVSAIAQHIEQGAEYYLVQSDEGPIGYFALAHNQNARSTLLSKIYVLPEEQGKGVGKIMLSFVEARCLELDIHDMWLTVNRNNGSAIGFYQRHGFEITDTKAKPIGEGFVMDDYIMSKKVSTQPGNADLNCI